MQEKLTVDVILSLFFKCSQVQAKTLKSATFDRELPWISKMKHMGRGTAVLRRKTCSESIKQTQC